MTKLEKTIQKLVEETNNSIKLDVLTWLDGSEAETLKDAINLLENVNCESADVSHLVYYVDCGSWVYEHEQAILELINEFTTSKIYDVDDIGWEQHNELSCEIPCWESGDDRMSRFEEAHWDEALELAEDDNEDWEQMSDDEQEYAIKEALDVLFYQEDAFELDKTDKVALAWYAFEQTAWRLAEELENIEEG